MLKKALILSIFFLTSFSSFHAAETAPTNTTKKERPACCQQAIRDCQLSGLLGATSTITTADLWINPLGRLVNPEKISGITFFSAITTLGLCGYFWHKDKEEIKQSWSQMAIISACAACGVYGLYSSVPLLLKKI